MPDKGYNPAYIAVGDDGHVSLFWGDGTEPHKEILWHGPRVSDNRELYLVIEDLKAWAEENGFTVVVPGYDLEVPDMDIDLPERDAERLTSKDIDELIDDLDVAEDDEDKYDEYNDLGENQ